MLLMNSLQNFDLVCKKQILKNLKKKKLRNDLLNQSRDLNLIFSKSRDMPSPGFCCGRPHIKVSAIVGFVFSYVTGKVIFDSHDQPGCVFVIE